MWCQEGGRIGSLPAGVMAQHFLLSAAARSLSAAKIIRMSDRGVENVFLRLRGPATNGKPVCPGCGCMVCHACPRPVANRAGAARRVKEISLITSGTVFVWHRLPLRTGEARCAPRPNAGGYRVAVNGGIAEWVRPASAR